MVSKSQLWTVFFFFVVIAVVVYLFHLGFSLYCFLSLNFIFVVVVVVYLLLLFICLFVFCARFFFFSLFTLSFLFFFFLADSPLWFTLPVARFPPPPHLPLRCLWSFFSSHFFLLMCHFFFFFLFFLSWLDNEKGDRICENSRVYAPVAFLILLFVAAVFNSFPVSTKLQKREGRWEHRKSPESLFFFFFLLLFIWHSFGFVASISKLADVFQPCGLPLFVFRCSCLLLRCGLVKLFTTGYSFVGPLICEYFFFFFFSAYIISGPFLLLCFSPLVCLFLVLPIPFIYRERSSVLLQLPPHDVYFVEVRKERKKWSKTVGVGAFLRWKVVK